MSEELRIETVDMVVTYLEKHPGNYEVRLITNCDGDLFCIEPLILYSSQMVLMIEKNIFINF
jgi:hypothetical protein